MESSSNQSRHEFQDVEKEKRLYDSPQLFGNRNEIMIRHKGEIYRIRITRNDKLIMNK